MNEVSRAGVMSLYHIGMVPVQKQNMINDITSNKVHFALCTYVRLIFGP